MINNYYMIPCSQELCLEKTEHSVNVCFGCNNFKGSNYWNLGYTITAGEFAECRWQGQALIGSGLSTDWECLHIYESNPLSWINGLIMVCTHFLLWWRKRHAWILYSFKYPCWAIRLNQNKNKSINGFWSPGN